MAEFIKVHAAKNVRAAKDTITPEEVVYINVARIVRVDDIPKSTQAVVRLEGGEVIVVRDEDRGRLVALLDTLLTKPT